jgi:hypothetical protein
VEPFIYKRRNVFICSFDWHSFLKKFILGYTASCIIQEWSLLLSAIVLLPIYGILPTILLTVPLFVLLHYESNNFSNTILLLLTTVWGIITIVLYVTLKQPLINV